ncbi:hypothetical protein EDB81DRAFT_867200 [Dactylonectria macrodidyma]|uniref:2-methylcitrate dehydratase n=1 Tax=Dactylonectria macrodidyma TaxID=307937 RepID=A0A9P9F908_9HYPO|nr:hypothetical protein EDB81DRAFT_867200 [Dactylonectria macrodidyma]
MKHSHGGLSASRTLNLVTWAAQLKFEDLPQHVVERAKDLFLDWYASALGGRHHAAVAAIDDFAKHMGPSDGRCEIIHAPGRKTSAAFAALINGAASHVIEQDDLHNSSMMHPATIVFPAALAVAQDVGASGQRFITACVAGYDAACRVGEYLGASHYASFHTTATSGVIGAAVTAAHLLKLSTEDTLSAVGTAATQAAGLWQFLLDATHSKQVHAAKACFDGVFAAYVAQSKLLGPRDALEGEKGMAASLVPGEPNPPALDRQLGTKYSILESSFKWHASCRHTHPSVDAILSIMKHNNLKMDDVQAVVCHTYRAAIDILTRSEKAETVHQSKFSMGFVLAVAAKYGKATVLDFTEEALKDPELRAFQRRVEMILDAEIDNAFPERWQGRVDIATKSGEALSELVEIVKGDPEKTLTRDELEQKILVIAEYAGIEDFERIKTNISLVWHLEREEQLTGFACS